jgi:hypothetical protein
MKKITYLFFLIMVTSAIANAQFFAGGSFSVSTSGGSYENNGTSSDKLSSFYFIFSPKGGYVISENLYVGAALSFSMWLTNSNGDPEVINNTLTYGFSPFVRYYAFRYKKFSLFGQGQPELSLSTSKTKTDGTTTEGPKSTTVGFSVFPGMAFDINEKVQLEAFISGFNLSFSHSIVKQDIGGIDYVEKTTNFGFGANLNNIVTSGSISIGAIIRF